MTRRILKYPHPLLTKPCDTVALFNDVVDEVIRDLRDTMKGVKWGRPLGLAAPQIGYSLAIFIAGKEVFVNPKVVNVSPTTYRTKEGCYSLAENVYNYPATRYSWLVLEYERRNGKKTMGRFHGLQAQVIQHELDHISGKLCHNGE